MPLPDFGAIDQTICPIKVSEDLENSLDKQSIIEDDSAKNDGNTLKVPKISAVKSLRISQALSENHNKNSST